MACCYRAFRQNVSFWPPTFTQTASVTAPALESRATIVRESPTALTTHKEAARVAKPETAETLHEKDLPGWVTSIYWCETHDFTVISTRSLENMSDQQATKQSLYDLNASLRYDSSFSLQKWLFFNTE